MTPDENLESELKRRTRFARLVHTPSCDSTQELAIAADTDGGRESDDAVFWADHQTRGRGRQQRVWDDEHGLDLAVTFRVTAELSRPVALPAGLPVAVLRAFEPAAARPLRIKWPNDVYVGARKLSGVLVDRDSRHPHTYRIGVGVNVNRLTFPGELAETATSLALETGGTFDRHALLLELAVQLDELLAAIERSDTAAHEQVFRERLSLLGRRVRVTAGAVREGTLRAIDFDRLTLDDGSEVPLAIVTALGPLP